MLHILLVILKIIGIILLAILGILILLLCVVFLVPLRYQVTAIFEGDLKKTKAEVKFAWLLHLFAGRIIYEEERLKYRIRILWKKISDDMTEKSPRAKDIEKVTGEIITEAPAEDKSEDIAEEKEKTVQKDSEKKTDKKAESKGEKSKENKFDKLKCTIKNVCDKIKMVLDFLKAESHQATLLRLKKEVARFLAFIRPKKLKGKVHFGTDDPYKTGQILAVLSVLYPFYGENIEIYSDFEQKILEGELYVKGHVRGVYALIIMINLLLDKNVRTTIKDIKALL